MMNAIHEKVETVALKASGLVPGDRVKRLREKLLNMEYTSSGEMARIAAEAYAEYADLPVIVRRAKSFERFLDRMTIYINPGELLVGNKTERPGAMHVVPEDVAPLPADTLLKCAIFNLDGLNEICECYESRLLVEGYTNLLSEEARIAEIEGLAGMAPGCQGGFGHIIGDYEKVIRLGAVEIARQARERQAEFAQKGMERQRDFCEASAIAFEAFSRWGVRYAKLADDLSETCADPVRKGELRDIAEVCRRVPALPARTFREALQCLLFVQLGAYIEQYNGSISISGCDRYLGPFAARDIEAGVSTYGRMSELMDCFFIKIMELAMHPKENQQFQHLSIGGQDADGNDRVNVASWLILDSCCKMGFSQPSVSVRWHKNIDRDFWRRACECTMMGFGMPSLHNDGVVLDILRKWGVAESEIWDYGIVGCNEPALRGKLHGQTLGAHINLAKCLELALNDGVSVNTGRRIGAPTGCLKDFSSIEDVYEAYRRQVEYAVRLVVECVHCAGRVQQEVYGYPFMSGLMEGALEEGRDLTYGVKYNFPTTCVLGTANAVDAMMALEDLVFADGGVDRTAAYNAWLRGFGGEDEDLRIRFRKHAEKFGNGHARSAEVYNRICAIHEKELEKYTGPRGGRFCSGVWPTSWHVTWGGKTWAGFDGREAGAYLADGVGPYQGGHTGGPTDVLRNMAAVDACAYWPGGYTFNMWFTASSMKSGEDMEKYRSLLETYFALGGEQIQINSIDKDILRNAQKRPDEYADLVIRVTGFSAYFCSLSRAMQDEVIDRAEYTA